MSIHLSRLLTLPLLAACGGGGLPAEGAVTDLYLDLSAERAQVVLSVDVDEDEGCVDLSPFIDSTLSGLSASYAYGFSDLGELEDLVLPGAEQSGPSCEPYAVVGFDDPASVAELEVLDLSLSSGDTPWDITLGNHPMQLRSLSVSDGFDPSRPAGQSLTLELSGPAGLSVGARVRAVTTNTAYDVVSFDGTVTPTETGLDIVLPGSMEGTVTEFQVFDLWRVFIEGCPEDVACEHEVEMVTVGL